jgi:hypothetical protein
LKIHSSGEAAGLVWLGMYDFDAVLQEANDVLWDALRSCVHTNGADACHLPEVPQPKPADCWLSNLTVAARVRLAREATT